MMSVEDDVLDEYNALSEAEKQAVSRSETALSAWIRKVLKWIEKNITVDDVVYITRRVWQIIKGG